MANFTLVADSTFKPFTYQELVTPIAHQQQVMDQLADEYDKLSSQADILEAMGKNDKDKKSGVYSQYQAYSNALREEADNLYRNGLNYDSRMRLSDLRRRYNKEIVPIQNAWNERKQEADTQMKARLQNPSLRFTRDAANSSLEEYINNPMGGYGVVDLKTVTAQMAGMAKNLTKQIRGSKGQLEGIDQYTYDYIKKYGLDANIISDWIKNPDRSPALTNMMNQVLAANGLSSEEFRNSPNGASLLAEATNAAQMGAWEAIGEDKSQVIENFGAREGLKHAHAVDMENRNFAHQVAVKQAPGYSDLHPAGDGAGGDYSPIFTTFDYMLPIAPANFNGAKDREEAMKTLGYTMGKDGKLHYNGKVTLSYRMTSEERDKKEKQLRNEYSALQAKVKKGTATEQEKNKCISYAQMIGKYGNLSGGRFQNTTSQASLYDSKGRIMTRKQFVAQAGNSPYAKKAYEEYFDKMVSAGKTLGVYGTLYTPAQLSKQYSTLRENSAAAMVRSIPLEYKKDAWNPTSTTMKLREITGFKEGKPVYSKERVSLGNLMRKKNSDGTEIDVSPYWVDDQGKQGLMIATHENGKDHRYYIDANEIGIPAIQDAVNKFRTSNTAFSLGDNSLGSSEREGAMAILNPVFTLTNNPATQSYNWQLSPEKRLNP